MIAALLAPYRIWIMLAIVVALFGSGFYGGHHWATTVAAAERTDAAAAALKQFSAERLRADTLATQLAGSEAKINDLNHEVIKHVKSVTTGRLCMGADAIRLLQPGATGRRASTGEPAAQGAAAAASDTDLAYWIADANQRYETAAARLNALIDFNGATVATP